MAALVFSIAAGRIGFVLRGIAPSWAAPLLLTCPVLGFAVSLAGGSVFFGMAITVAAMAVAADAATRSATAASQEGRI
jgi:hypothetical protein